MIKASALIRHTEYIKSPGIQFGVNIFKVLYEIGLMLNAVMRGNGVIFGIYLVIAFREYILYVRNIFRMTTWCGCGSVDQGFLV
jgi:hypothetical protein